MSKMCNKCLHFYEDNLNVCPYCNTQENGEKMHIFNKEQDKIDNIIFNPVENIVKEQKQISTKNIKKQEKYNIYSYICLIISFILLFIICLYTVKEFNAPIFIHYSITAICLILAFKFSLNNKYGYYIGIISSISMIAMLYWKDYVNFAVGIYLLVSSLVMLIKNN